MEKLPRPKYLFNQNWLEYYHVHANSIKLILLLTSENFQQFSNNN